jgi:hypothetical protein
MHHHHHLLIIAKFAIVAGTALALHQLQRPGNGLVVPAPYRAVAHPIAVTGK